LVIDLEAQVIVDINILFQMNESRAVTDIEAKLNSNSKPPKSHDKIGHCSLCDKEKSLVRSHIIPQWVFRHDLSDETLSKHVICMSNDPKSNAVTLSPGAVGEYDPNILCSECDNKFSAWEQHFKEQIFERIDLFQTCPGKPALPILAYVADGFDYQKIKLFFLSMLWKASISSHPFFSLVKCDDRCEAELKTALKDSNAGDVEYFSVFGQRYCDTHLTRVPPDSILSPVLVQRNEVYFYKFNFLNFQFLIKVDERNTPENLLISCLKPNSEWLIGGLVFIDSLHYKATLDITKKIRAEYKDGKSYKALRKLHRFLQDEKNRLEMQKELNG
jgi:hypothetical protein